MIIDNLKDRYPDDGMDIITVWDFINYFAGLDAGQTGRLDIVTGYFTIRALAKLDACLPKEDKFRIISSELLSSDDSDDYHIIDLLNGDFSVESTFTLTEMAKRAKAFLERDNVQVRAVVDAFCHAKAYIFTNKKIRPDSINFYLTGSSNLTDAGLGLKRSANIELNIGTRTLPNENEFTELSKWYNDIWKNAKEKIKADKDSGKEGLIPVKDYFISRIEKLFREYTPEELYYKILYEIFKSDLEIDPSIEHTRDMSLLQTSVIWNTLYNYQQKGVISIIKMLRNYGGAILADAVGLGKTFSALAVIKYFQIQGYVTIVLCPKKLESNWTQYQRRAGSRFDRDDLDYIVRFHTDLQDNRLEDSYDTAKLSWLKRCMKVLVVIDESHNLRNDKSSRYRCLLSELIQDDPEREGRDVKVLMLSATPINTGLRDIRGQFNLIGRGDDSRFDDETFGVKSLEILFRTAQNTYNSWCCETNRTVGGLIARLDPRFFSLTDRLIVARTRSLIEKTLGEDLGFPEKDAPDNRYISVEGFGKYESTQAVYDAFDSLTLTAYQPSLFIPESQKIARREARKDWQDNVLRERYLVKMMSILFMKRLESCWHSCLTTVEKVLTVHEDTLKKVVDFKENGKRADVNAQVITEDDEEMEQEEFTLRKGTIRLSDMKNLGGFEKGLRINVNKLREIRDGLLNYEKNYRAGSVRDPKLDALEQILRDKEKAANKKTVIFTTYTDTALFLFDELRSRGFSRMACVGGTIVRTTGNHPTTHFVKVLESFAPYSKLYKEKDWDDLYEDAQLSRADYYDESRRRWHVPYDKWLQLIAAHRPDVQRQLDDSIDILIATDCLSEGQNLQDADLQVNYDIHWNPVRLIQRFGRIDRLGSMNAKIRCVNFWPAQSFDDYLNLERRIKNRMAAMDIIGTETQLLDEQYKRMIQDNPLVKENEQRLLRELSENSISDIESSQALTLQDFSLETFRQDLLDYFNKYKAQLEAMPCGIFSGFKVSDDLFSRYDESLIAVIGHRPKAKDVKKETRSGKPPYDAIFLLCQPVGREASAVVMNKADILTFLRQNKRAERFVPEWIDRQDNNSISRLSALVDDWMKAKAPRQAEDDISSLLRGGNPADNGPTEDYFSKGNFDLIVWEYISRKQ